MALQRVPWAVNGEDVAHSATLARQANFAAMGGQTGIVGPDSLVVTAGETPGPFVNVGPGAGTITYAQGRANRQEYAYTSYKDQLVPVRNDALHEVAINPTTSAGGRVDLVVVEINDPEAEGTADSVDYSSHEFVRFRVIQGVSSSIQHPWQLSSLPRPVLPLARVHIPASTATITEDMIEDVRHMAMSHSVSMPLIGEVSSTGDYEDIPPSQSNWRTVYTFTDINVPSWATRVHLSMSLGPLWASGGLARGYFRLVGTGEARSLSTEAVAFVSEGVQDRYTPTAAGTHLVSWRTSGGNAEVALQVRRWTGNPGQGNIRFAGGGTSSTMASGWITYEEHPRFDTESGL